MATRLSPAVRRVAGPERSELVYYPQSSPVRVAPPCLLRNPHHTHPARRISGELMVLLQRLEVTSCFDPCL